MFPRLPLLAACASLACLGTALVTAADEEAVMQSACETDPDGTPTAETKDAADTECVTAPDDNGKDAKAYWTPERMRNAKPLPTPTIDPETLKPVEPE